MATQLSPISAAAKALRRFVVSLGHLAVLAAAALDHGVPA
jgi:hypothetical protein